MELKIFSVGFDVNEFNKFCNENIVYKMHFLNDGGIYVMWKPANKIGRTPIEEIEELDRLVKQAESEIVAHEIDKSNAESKIADLKEEINKFHTNQNEWKKLDAEIKVKETNVKMANETIAERQITITNAKARHMQLLTA